MIELGARLGDIERLGRASSLYETAAAQLAQQGEGIKVAFIRNSQAVAKQIIAQLSGDYGGLDEALLGYERALGLLKGVPFGPERGAILNNIGYALVLMGEVAPSRKAEEAFRRAIAAYEASLEIRTRRYQPVAWATTKKNLGQAFGDLGKLLGEPELLREGIANYREALSVRVKWRFPIDWARSQNDIGYWLAVLASQEGQEGRPELGWKALEAVHLALEVLDRKSGGVLWAAAQHSRGFALATVGDLTASPSCVETGLRAYALAIGFYRGQGLKVPEKWIEDQRSAERWLTAGSSKETDPNRARCADL